jgi:hypothetical protein
MPALLTKSTVVFGDIDVVRMERFIGLRQGGFAVARL